MARLELQFGEAEEPLDPIRLSLESQPQTPASLEHTLMDHPHIERTFPTLCGRMSGLKVHHLIFLSS